MMKSGVGAPGRSAKPWVASSRCSFAVQPVHGRLIGNVYCSPVALLWIHLLARKVSSGAPQHSFISTNMMVRSALVKISLKRHRCEAPRAGVPEMAAAQAQRTSTARTKFDDRVFEVMRSASFLVNVSRGRRYCGRVGAGRDGSSVPALPSAPREIGTARTRLAGVRCAPGSAEMVVRASAGRIAVPRAFPSVSHHGAMCFISPDGHP